MGFDVLFNFTVGRVRTAARGSQQAARWFGHLERRLEGREWLAVPDFTVADIAMASVLRSIRHTDLMSPFPRIKSYFERCHARPAWQHTLTLAAERLHKNVDSLR